MPVQSSEADTPPLPPVPPQLYDAVGMHEYAGYNAESQEFSAEGCTRYPGACLAVIGSLCGRNPRGNIAHTILPGMMRHLPAGTSVHNMKHWGQVRKCHPTVTHMRKCTQH